jgi:hypothetical protein
MHVSETNAGVVSPATSRVPGAARGHPSRDAYHLGEDGMQLAINELKSKPEFRALLPKLN